MLEKMREFFENRLDGYDEHMLNEIESAREFYPFTAKQLPMGEECNIIDLGCGTGLELEKYFQMNPSAQVTGIDLSEKMLETLKNKFPNKKITLIQGSYFDVPLGENIYDCAVSVESLHHFTKEEKVSLYTKLVGALKEKGYFILTDYLALSQEEEQKYRQDLLDLKKAQGILDDEFYHYDTPLTVEHEIEALLEAGFAEVEVLNRWGATYTLKAKKKKKVAFICVHNSCRSQIAEALGKHLALDVFESYSAGTETKPQINQDAVRIMKELYGIDMEQSQYSKLITEIPNPDIAISMGCNVGCPFIGRAFDDNWGLEDPTGKSDDEFKLIISEIENKIVQLKNELI